MIYFLIQFDDGVRRRNFVDFNYTVFVVALRLCLGFPHRTNGPTKLWLRILYFLMMFIPQFYHALIGVFLYRFMKVDAYWQQIASVQQLIQNDFHLIGFPDMLEIMKRNSIVSS